MNGGDVIWVFTAATCIKDHKFPAESMAGGGAGGALCVCVWKLGDVTGQWPQHTGLFPPRTLCSL